MRSALDAKRHNLRVKFCDEIEKKLGSFKTINPFAIPPEAIGEDKPQSGEKQDLDDQDPKMPYLVVSFFLCTTPNL